jgi:hypothetical protein
MNSLEYIERELEWLRKGGSRQLDQEVEIKNLENVKSDLERLEKLEKVVNDFLEYLSKEPNKTIPKHSIKQTFDKLLKEVFGE